MIFSKNDITNIQMTFDLLNFYIRHEFVEMLETPWRANMCVNEMAIQKKIARGAKKKRGYLDSELQSRIAIMITNFCELAEIPLSQIDTKSRKTMVSLEEYVQLHHFICEKAQLATTALHWEFAQYQEPLFAMNEHLREVINVLLAKNTLNDGFERDSFNSLYQSLIQTKPSDYFSNGYCFDLLVHDRVDAMDSTLDVLLVNQDHLSTYLCTNEQISKFTHLTPYHV